MWIVLQAADAAAEAAAIDPTKFGDVPLIQSQNQSDKKYVE